MDKLHMDVSIKELICVFEFYSLVLIKISSYVLLQCTHLNVGEPYLTDKYSRLNF